MENGAFNSLSVTPQALETVNFGPSSRQLMLSYNTSYSVSVVASLCGQIISHSIELHYGELLQYWYGHVLGSIQYITAQCISLLHLLSEENKSLVIANYSCPAIEETIAVFSCNSSGYRLTGPSTVTCMGNGEWVPDPRKVQCEGSIGPALMQCLCMHSVYSN